MIPINTRRYPKYPKIPENTRNTRKYPRVKEIPGNTRSYISTLLPDPNPTRYPVFCPIPDPTRPDIEKPYPLGTGNSLKIRLSLVIVSPVILQSCLDCKMFSFFYELTCLQYPCVGSFRVSNPDQAVLLLEIFNSISGVFGGCQVSSVDLPK